MQSLSIWQMLECAVREPERLWEFAPSAGDDYLSPAPWQNYTILLTDSVQLFILFLFITISLWLNFCLESRFIDKKFKTMQVLQ